MPGKGFDLALNLSRFAGEVSEGGVLRHHPQSLLFTATPNHHGNGRQRCWLIDCLRDFVVLAID